MDRKDLTTTSPEGSSDDSEIFVEHNPASIDSPDELDDSVDKPHVETVPVPVRPKQVAVVSDAMGRRRFSSAGDPEQENFSAPRITPQVNCQEKIIICLDMSDDMDEVPFRLGDGSKYSPLYMAKRVIELFVHSKNKMDKKHEYALVALYETASWIKDFTNDPKEISDVLDDLLETKPCSSFDLSSFFKSIESRIDLPRMNHVDVTVVPPPYVVRTIILYGRSRSIPKFFTDKSALKNLYTSHYFFLDVFYIHVTPSEANKCEDIFDALCELDEKGTSYVVEVSRNPAKLHDSMAKLLAHPLQRPYQRDVGYHLGKQEN